LFGLPRGLGVRLWAVEMKIRRSARLEGAMQASVSGYSGRGETKGKGPKQTSDQKQRCL